MFRFKNISNLDMGVIAEEENFTGRAPIKYEEVNFDGKNGSSFNELGYSNITKTVSLQILSDNLDDVYSWLSGEGEFEFNERVTNARFYDVVEAVRNGGIKVITATFIRDPFWHKCDNSFFKVKNHVSNEGNVISRPIFRLMKTNTDKVDITINGIRLVYTFDDDEYVDIDCENKTEIANNKSKAKNIEMGFEYPYLNIGKNTITINGGSADIFAKYKDRWL